MSRQHMLIAGPQTVSAQQKLCVPLCKKPDKSVSVTVPAARAHINDNAVHHWQLASKSAVARGLARASEVCHQVAWSTLVVLVDAFCSQQICLSWIGLCVRLRHDDPDGLQQLLAAVDEIS